MSETQGIAHYEREVKEKAVYDLRKTKKTYSSFIHRLHTHAL